ncbi:hypothetical protein HY029_03155 [Candidatus Gottesmanbacteria bacterium]|nr:hypothetical protein [Candidatus Gottesmanbacteria bacterium]
MLVERRILITTPREGLQQAGAFPKDGRLGINDPNLLPPAQIIEAGAINLLKDLITRRDLMVELPNPISCPSAAKMVNRILTTAQTFGVSDRVPVHTRMTKKDFNLAVVCGATAVHLYGNSSDLAGRKGQSIEKLTDSLEEIADDAYKSGVNHLRASLEQATATPIDKIVQFVTKIKEINGKYPRKVITAIGLPDTNGLATPDQYQKILTKEVTQLIRDSGLTLFIHLHDDGNNALDNAKTIMEIAKAENISVVVETVPKEYPGERVGIRPWYSDLAELGFPGELPKSATEILEGSSWVLKYPELRDIAKLTNTAGVHTDDMERYANGNHGIFPSPGLYSIMGAKNFGFLQEHTLPIDIGKVSTIEVLRSAALIGRELAVQYGNQSQAVAIALAELAFNKPDLVQSVSSRFNNHNIWLEDDVPDLRVICDLLHKIIYDKWKMNINFQKRV